jgi:hypothetical protein
VFGSNRQRAVGVLVAIAIALCLITEATLVAQDSINLAEAFVRTAYDDLRDESLRVHITLSNVAPGILLDWNRLNQVWVQIERGREPRYAMTRDDEESQLLGVSLRFDVFGFLSSVASSGTYVHTRELREVVGFADGHRDWTDASLLAELRRRGAQLAGDKAEFEKRVGLLRFEPLLGRIVKQTIRFEGRTKSSRTDIPDSFSFTWEVDLETEPVPGARQRINLAFEPFDGRLISLRRSYSRALVESLGLQPDPPTQFVAP